MESPHSPAAAESTASRAWYNGTIADFLGARPDSVIGQLAMNSDFPDIPAQKAAWLAQIDFLRGKVTSLTGALFLEFNYPRRFYRFGQH